MSPCSLQDPLLKDSGGVMNERHKYNTYIIQVGFQHVDSLMNRVHFSVHDFLYSSFSCERLFIFRDVYLIIIS